MRINWLLEKEIEKKILKDYLKETLFDCMVPQFIDSIYFLKNIPNEAFILDTVILLSNFYCQLGYF